MQRERLASILLSTDCCDALSPRAVRVSLGHVFHIPLLQGNLVAMLDELKQAKVMTMAAIVQDAKFLDEVPILPQRWALVLGSEHYGVSAAVRAVCDLPLKVRMADGVDSLNVVTSAGVLIHGCVEREHSDSDFMLHKPGEKRRQMANLFHLSRICILSLLQGTCLASLSNVQDDQSVAAKLAARYAAAASLAQRHNDMEDGDSNADSFT
eukprot:g3370.t1